METQPVISRLTIINRDRAACIWFLLAMPCTLFFCSFSIAPLAANQGAPMGDGLLGLVCGLMALIGAPFFLCFLRVQLVKGVLERGKRTRGIVSNLGRASHPPKRVSYTYEVAGKQYEAHNAVLVGAQSPLSRGQEVEVAYSPKNPGKSLLPILYRANG